MSSRVPGRVACAAIAVLICAGASVAQTTVAVSPSTKFVTTGTSFTLDVLVGSVTNLHAAKLVVTFDNSIIQVSGVATDGKFLSGGGDVFAATLPEPGPAVYSIEIDQAILGSGAVSGSGVLLTLTFNATGAGTSPVLLSGVDLRNNAAPPEQIPVSIQPGSVTVSPPGIVVNAKAWLQGPYASGSMGTSLKAAGSIPLSQPYTTPPWNYTGSEFVASIPAGVVDWVLVEVRSGTAAATIAGRRAAFIRSDGTIVDVDGSSPVLFGGISTGSYYLVLRHRNHLAVMSAAAVALSASSALYDFTTGPGQYYGGEAAAVASGVYGLWAGDVSGNGVLKYMGSGNDRSPILTRIGGTSLTATVNGYFAEDVNMNGVVKYMGTGNDRSIILANVGGNLTATKTTQVPD